MISSPESPRSKPQKRGRNGADETKHPIQQQISLWTDWLPASDHITWFKNIDWVSTPLGPLEEWSSSLRFATNMLFNDSRGAAVYWGSAYTGLYNEKFIPIISSAHPVLMGNSFEVGFPSAWSDMKHVFDTVFSKGECVEFQKMELLLNQGNGYLEEAYYVGQFIPLKNDFGVVEGTYNSGYESTAQVLYERRREQLDKLAAVPTGNLTQVFGGVTSALGSNPRDVSMALIYSVDEEQQLGKTIVKLECSLGVPAGHVCAPLDGILGEAQAGFLPYFERVKITMEALLFSAAIGNLDLEIGHLLEGIEWQGWGDPCRDLSIVPLQSASNLIGFLVIATNPRRKYDQSSAQFVIDIAQQITIRWSSATTAEKAYQRERRLMQELAETEQRIRHMALCAPVGMVQLTVDGKVDWANDQWYDLTSNSKTAHGSPIWLDCYMEESQQEALRQWELLLQGSNTSAELQLRREFKPPVPDDTTHYMWVIALGFPMVVDGTVKYIMGTLTDVSRLKWAESVQARNAELAATAKRQQEEFIDISEFIQKFVLGVGYFADNLPIASHEMRNPLSAIYQCASMIATSLNELPYSNSNLLEALKNNVDAANTILICAQHQKRIVDDVLILNRLETMMLSITPVAVDVPVLVDAAAKIFSAEVDTAKVDLVVIRHPSFDEEVVDLVYCDPSRLTQIFINLISNAIKFIRDRSRRTIRIRYGVTLNVPTDDEITMTGENFYWASEINRPVDPTVDKEWGDGQPLYLCFSVQDTGPGLEQDEIPRLFARFSQANARTHVTYGGSGLGLYISNALAQRQGGRMGIASTIGVGTNIAFYVKCRRVLTSHDVHDAMIHDDPMSKAVRSNVAPSVTIEESSSTTNHTNGDPKELSRLHSKTNNPQIRLLLVEDNLINQKILRKQLQKKGCEVYVANHGEDAIVFLNERSTNWTMEDNKSDSNNVTIDLILMDWEMPIMDGLACTKVIRQIEIERNITRIPIIGTTANARIEQLQAAMESGMDDVITKPFLVEELLIKIRHWLEK